MNQEQATIRVRALTNVSKPSNRQYYRSTFDDISSGQLDNTIHEYRSYICAAAQSAVWFSVLVSPIPSGDTTLDDEQADKLRICSGAMNLLESLTPRELMGLFYEDSEDIRLRTSEFIQKYDADSQLGAQALELVWDIWHWDTSSVWEAFMSELFDASAYSAKATGVSNIYNDFRISKGYTSDWDKE